LGARYVATLERGARKRSKVNAVEMTVRVWFVPFSPTGTSRSNRVGVQ
jgi:hypothetical protein